MVKPIAIKTGARRNRGESAIERLRRDILHGKYKAGTRLPPERELAERLGTNRNTLREALRTLEAENLVVARQGDGTIVRDWRRSGELDLLSFWLAEGDLRVDELFNTLYPLILLRQDLFERILAQAIQNGGDEDLDVIDEAIRALELAGDADWIALDRLALQAFAIASHSPSLLWLQNSIHRIFAEHAQRNPGVWVREPAHVERLRRIARHLRDKKLDRAREEIVHLFQAQANAIIQEVRPAAAAGPRKAARTARR